MEYVNPPLLAALLVPLLPLGVPAGDLLWRLLTLVVAGGALVWVAACPGASARPRAVARPALLLLCYFPFVEGWHHRGVVALLLLAFGGWMALTRAGRPRLAGLLLSLLLLKPQYAVFPLVYLLWRRERRQLEGWLLGAALQAVLTVGVLVAPSGLPSLDALGPFFTFGGSGSGAVVEYHVNLRAAILNLLPGAAPDVQIVLLAVTSVVAVAGILAALPRQTLEPETGPRGVAVAGQSAWGWEMLAVAAATNLTAPYNHITGLVLLLPPAALLLGTSTAQTRVGAARTPLLVLALALPSLGIVLAVFSLWWYVLAAWGSALIALGIGVTGARGWAGWSWGAPTPSLVER